MKPLCTGKRAVAVDVTSASWAYSSSDNSNVQPIGIQCNASTTITGALLKDATETAWILPAGVHWLAFRSINTSSTTKNGFKILFDE